MSLTQLANERTFLAWLRTSIVFVSVGVALAQLLRLADSNSKLEIFLYTVYLRPGSFRGFALAKPISSVCIILGILVLIMGFIRYNHVTFQMVNGHFPMLMISALFVAIAALAVIILYVVLAMVGVLRHVF